MDVVQIIDSVSTWPVSVTNTASARFAAWDGVCIHMTTLFYSYLSPYDRIVEAFEVIVASTVRNQNFTEVLVEENDVALLAERVRLMQL